MTGAAKCPGESRRGLASPRPLVMRGLVGGDVGETLCAADAALAGARMTNRLNGEGFLPLGL
jgi:hypothetical protein